MSRAPLVALLALAVGCTREPPAPPPPSGPPLVFGILPAVDEEAAQADCATLLAELQAVVKRPVTLHVADDYQSLVDDVVAGRVHVAQLSAYLYVRAKGAVALDVLAQQRMAWDTEYRGAFVVEQRAPITTVDALAGKTFAYVSPSSSAGYFYPRIKLRALGHDPDTFFGETVFAGSHQDVIALLEQGQADAGVISEQTLSQDLHLRVLAKTDVIPDDAIVAGPSLSEKERAALESFFMEAHQNPKLNVFMNRRGIETYVEPDLKVYGPLEKEMGLTTTVKAD